MEVRFCVREFPSPNLEHTKPKLAAEQGSLSLARKEKLRGLWVTRYSGWSLRHPTALDSDFDERRLRVSSGTLILVLRPQCFEVTCRFMTF